MTERIDLDSTVDDLAKNVVYSPVTVMLTPVFNVVPMVVFRRLVLCILFTPPAAASLFVGLCDLSTVPYL